MSHGVSANLEIDLTDPSHPLARIGDLRREGKWVEFFGALAIARTDPHRSTEYLTHEQLHRMLMWNHDTKLESVGKMVTRQWDDLRKKCDVDVIESPYKTKRWRLKIAPSSILFSPNRTSVEEWVRTRFIVDETHDTWLDELEALILAQIALLNGRGESASDLVLPHAVATHPDFEGWLGLLHARATDLHVSNRDDPNALEDILEDWSHRIDVVGRSVAARISARIALRTRFSNLEAQRSKLSKIAADLEASGDIGALAVVLNVQGVLSTRAGAPDVATSYHRRAAGLFGLIGDYNSLQASLFNLANCRAKARAKLRMMPDERSFRLLDLCERVCDAFNVGRDSVQSEVAACHWHLDLGDFAKARAALAAGSRLVDNLDSELDQACYLLARGRLEFLDEEGKDPTRDLNAARRLFEKFSDRVAIQEIDEMLAALRSRPGHV